MSFSVDLRTEVIGRLATSTVDKDAMRALLIYASGRRTETGFLLETRHAEYYNWLATSLADDGWQDQSVNTVYRFLVKTSLRLEQALAWLRSKDDAISNDALALLFAACGSMADPTRAAHMEYRLKNQVVAASFLQMAARLGISLRTLPHDKHVRLYSKASQTIGEILIRSGATNAYIQFSQMKVNKEVLNNVNRQVNCDRANARRVAESSADQAEAIRRLDAAIGLSTLPETLEIAARARLEHPDLSLAELGATVEPPIGKSGMNHRLQKLLALVAELEQ